MASPAGQTAASQQMGAATTSTSASALDRPKTIKYESVVIDLCFHPQRDVIASGLIEGDVMVHSYSLTEDCHELLSLNHHKKAVRAVRFSPSGDWLSTVSKDKSLRVIDMEHGAVKHTIKKAHEESIYSLLVVDENIVATGDDDGRLKVWDLRRETSVMDIKENEDFLSDMVVDSAGRVLVASSGDGTLTSFDIRKHKMKVQSELFDSELLSLAVVKRGQKMACGTGEGIINIFNWGEFGNMSDRLTGHPESVDCMVALTENVICTGSMDGKIRAVHIVPNRIIGEVGHHDEFPIENMSLSRCKNFLASCSHDQSVRFWNVAKVPDEKVHASKRVKAISKTKKLGTSGASQDFFSDLAPEETHQNDEDDDSDGNIDSDDGDDVEGDDSDGNLYQEGSEEKDKKDIPKKRDDDSDDAKDIDDNSDDGDFEDKGEGTEKSRKSKKR